MKILVAGNFGFKDNVIGGQTLKTRTIYDTIIQMPGVEAQYLDISTNGYLHFLVRLLSIGMHFEKIFFLPGIRSLYITTPFLILLKMLHKCELHYIVVGGWLPNLLKSRYIRTLLPHFDSINCELKSMLLPVRAVNPNTFVLTNYRQREPSLFRMYAKTEKTIQLTFVSRITADKGIFLALDLVRRLVTHGYKITLDIYGPLGNAADLDKDRFYRIVNAYEDTVKYHGCVDPAKIQHAIQGKDILLFPTSYPGEGFPGCVVDAKFSGLAVIATDWKYNYEVIQDGQNGHVISGSYVDEAYNLITSFIDNPTLLHELKSNSLDSASEYSDQAFYNWFTDRFGTLKRQAA